MESERLILRHWTESDAHALYEIARDPLVGPPCGWPVHESVDDSLKVIKTILTGNPEEDTYAIIRKTDKAVMGNVSLHRDTLRKNDRIMALGYYLGTPYRHMGYMHEACMRMIEYGFEELGLDAVSVEHFSFNQESRKVIEKLGFTHTGHIQHYGTSPDGKEIDLMIYILEKDDFFHSK
ncbi:MAG: GNAT family N-acetyltransferase [Bullifex sp.]